MSSKPTAIEYRKRTIKAMEMSKGAAAMIHPDVHRINGETVEEVIQLAKDWIDTKYRDQYKMRRQAHIGTTQEYIRALQFLPLGPHEHAMLAAHRNAPNQRLSATEISQAAGWGDAGSANIHYGYLGRRIAEYLELALSDKDDKHWTESMAKYDEDAWIMHPELVEALDKLDIV